MEIRMQKRNLPKYVSLKQTQLSLLRSWVKTEAEYAAEKVKGIDKVEDRDFMDVTNISYGNFIEFTIKNNL